LASKAPNERGPILLTIASQKAASGGPAGDQTFEKFDKQAFRSISIHSKMLIWRLDVY